MIFLDRKLKPKGIVSLRCLAGTHYDLLRQISDEQQRETSVFYCDMVPIQASVACVEELLRQRTDNLRVPGLNFA